MNNKKLKILITTGIYPPQIGGPAQYAKNLRDEFERLGYEVKVKTYGLENSLPTGLRHLFFFFKIIPALLSAEVALTLDTFSVGLPTVLACRIFGKKSVIRTGGDFLWEQYVERTKKKVLLRDFYNTEISNFSAKEKIIFKITKWTLHNATRIVFSTEWQRGIFARTYGLEPGSLCIIENYYGPKESDEEYVSKTFVASSRKLFLKNNEALREIFNSEEIKKSGAEVFDHNIPFQEFMRKLRHCYAVVTVSFSEISPNLILDAIRLNRPFICTKEVGIYERIKNAGIFIDPLNVAEIKRAVLNLLDEEGYKKAKEKVRSFDFTHTWGEIGGEFIKVFKSI